MLQKILFAVIAILVILQFFQIDKTNPESDPEMDFIAITNPPSEIGIMLKEACYDCHSFKTKYPWYTYTQPLGWWIGHHIEEGRDEMNFSEWGTYNQRRADHKLEESAELVLEEEMPLPSYLIAHSEAKLTSEERKQLADWFEVQRDILMSDTTTSLEN